MPRKTVVVQPRRGPSLVETMARTAVIAGTATVTANAVNQSAAKRQQAQHSAAQTQAEMADMQAAAAQAQPAGGQPDVIAQIQQLAQLNAAGVLSDAEFEAAKARLLGI